jgi:2-iminobutanoate/2-iminopropanoate deaminase
MTTARVAGRTDRAPAPAGPYSQSVRRGALVAAAGQVGKSTDGVFATGVAAQTRVALHNLLAVLAASGATERDVLSVRVFLTDPDHFAEMNAVYAEVFTDPYPARTTVYVRLRGEMLVEVDALAVLSG